MIKTLSAEHAFLAPPEIELTQIENSKVAIQLLPYEHTSSYHQGSFKGPKAIIEASHYVEFTTKKPTPNATAKRALPPFRNSTLMAPLMPMQ